MIVKEYNSIDRKIIHFLQGDIPLKPNPYAELAASLHISEKEIVARIRVLKQKGIIRRCGAVLRHQKAGYRANAMVAWQVDPSRQDTAGELLAGFKAVSHCYLREEDRRFPYNLFTMVHAGTEQELLAIIDQMAKVSAINKYIILKTLAELKKTSMIYI